MSNDTSRILRLGAIGLGRAFASMAPSLRNHPCVKLMAAADPQDTALKNCARAFNTRSYSDTAKLLEDPEIDAVYIATPHELHASQAMAAFAQGKHVILEKPMALSLEESLRIIDAGERAGRVLVVGHSHGFDPPVHYAARLIGSGALGKIRMVSALDYTSWIYRARRPEELTGAGVTLNQASHQVDIVRLLAGGLATTVRASCGAWDPDRMMIGAYSALLNFANGAFASLTYNGYDYFDSDELMGWISETGRPKQPQNAVMRRALEATTSEANAHAQAGFGAENATVRDDTVGDRGQAHQHFGVVIASCDHGDLRTTPNGITLFNKDGRRDFSVPPGRGGASRAGVFDELYDAAVNGVPAVHDGRWALANLEACLALAESSQNGRDIPLRHQVAPALRPLTLEQLAAL